MKASKERSRNGGDMNESVAFQRECGAQARCARCGSGAVHVLFICRAASQESGSDRGCPGKVADRVRGAFEGGMGEGNGVCQGRGGPPGKRIKGHSGATAVSER